MEVSAYRELTVHAFFYKKLVIRNGRRSFSKVKKQLCPH